MPNFFHDGEANEITAQTPSSGRRSFLSGGMIASAAGLAALLYPVKAAAQSAGQWFDVTAYGAVGNGSNYDWPGINSAIGAMPGSGGILYFPPGKRYWLGDSSSQHPAKEIQLRVDGTTVLAWGAEIFAAR
jgi:polygalacturonase